MYEAARILIEALQTVVAADEAAADALFSAASAIAGHGNDAEAELTRRLSRMHRIKALSLRSQITTIRINAVLHYRQSKL